MKYETQAIYLLWTGINYSHEDQDEAMLTACSLKQFVKINYVHGRLR